jgi:hypothetical protein
MHMSKDVTLTVTCPDGIQRQAQIYPSGVASVRVGGRRFQGTIHAADAGNGATYNEFRATGAGKNGNIFRYYV